MPGHGFFWRFGALSLGCLSAGVVYILAQALLRCPEQAFITRILDRKDGP
jgi:hypothetical protein